MKGKLPVPTFNFCIQSKNYTMMERASFYCRSASLCLCPRVSCLQFVFRKLKATGQDIHRTSHMSIWIMAICCVFICMCDFTLCVYVFVCLIIFVSVLMTGLGPGRGVILQWSACNSRTEYRCEQRWTGSDQTETTKVILTDPLWHQQRCTTKILYSTLFYSIIHSFYILIYTLSHKHK